MKLRLKDLSTPENPNPFCFMLAWSMSGLDQIDFGKVEVIHVSRREDQIDFKHIVEKKRLSCVIRYDQEISPDEMLQHSFTYFQGKLTRYETMSSTGESYWTKFAYNEFGMPVSVEHSCGAKIQVTYDGQSNVVSVVGNDKAKKDIAWRYQMQWCEESKILDCRNVALQAEDKDSPIPDPFDPSHL